MLVALIVLVGTLCISKVENVAVTTPTFLEAMRISIPYIVVGQFCLYHLFNKAPSIMVGWLSWTVAMSLMRLANSRFVLQESLDYRWAALAVVLMFTSALCMKQA